MGGGPAGTACATVLACHGQRVVVAEQSDYSAFRIGETIDASTKPLLERLGVEMASIGRYATPCAGVESRWGGGVSPARTSIWNAYGQGWCVNRPAFDQMLAEVASRCGAQVLLNARLEGASEQANEWTCTIRTKEGRLRVHAGFLVDAGGRRRSVVVPQARRRYFDHLVGIALIHARGRSWNLDRGPAVEARPDGWWYVAPLPQEKMLMVLFTDADLLPPGTQRVARFLLEQAMQSDLIQERPYVDACETFSRHRVFDARSSVRVVAGARYWAAAGDALMAFDPLCGRGVTNAIASGIELAEWLLDRHDGPGIPSWTRRAVLRINHFLAERIQVYGAETRWRHRPFWSRRTRLPS